MKKYFLYFFLFGLNGLVVAQNPFTESKIKAHVEYLASDKLEGREPGTIGEKLAAAYIEEQFKSIGLTPKGTKSYFQAFDYKALVNPHDSITVRKKGINIIGYLDNHADSTVVVGGHYDHLGKLGHSSSLDKNSKQIHNGADDNASGTAGVIELARYFSNNKITEKCNFLFICFSAEEDGLMGSKYFTNNPTVNLNKIKCMVNMDMIGRLNDSTNKLLVYGVGTSPSFTKVFSKINTNLKFVFDSSGVGPSDHTSFYLKNIPVLHFFTGQHHDYHKSTDDASKINYAGEVSVLYVIEQVLWKICNAHEMKFTPTKNNDGPKINFKVTLGIMPDYSFEGEGIRVDAVTDGKPAYVGGIQAGDVIVQMGEIKTPNMSGYMKGLISFKKGDTTTVIVNRNTEQVKVKVTF